MTLEKDGIPNHQRKRSKNIHGLRAYGLLYRIWVSSIEKKVPQEKIIRHLPTASDK